MENTKNKIIQQMSSGKRTFIDPRLNLSKMCFVCDEELKTEQINQCINCKFVYCSACFKAEDKCAYCKSLLKAKRISLHKTTLEFSEEEYKRKQKLNDNFSCNCELVLPYQHYKAHILTCRKLLIKCIKCNFTGCREYFGHKCELELIKFYFDKLDNKIKSNLIYGLTAEINHEENTTHKKVDHEPSIFLFTGHSTGKINMYNFPSGKLMTSFDSCTSAVRCLLPFYNNSNDLKVAVSLSNQGIKILNLSNFKFSDFISTNVARSFSTVKLKNKNYLIIGFCQGFIEIRDVDSFTVLMKFDYNQRGNRNTFVLNSSPTENEFVMCSYTFETNKIIKVNINKQSSAITSSTNYDYDIMCSIGGIFEGRHVCYLGLSDKSIIGNFQDVYYTLEGHKSVPIYLKYLSKYMGKKDILISVSEYGELIIWETKFNKGIYFRDLINYKPQSLVNITHVESTDDLIVVYVNKQNDLVKIYIPDDIQTSTIEASCESLTCINSFCL